MHQLDQAGLVAHFGEIFVEFEAGVLLLVFLPLQKILYPRSDGAVARSGAPMARGHSRSRCLVSAALPLTVEIKAILPWVTDCSLVARTQTFNSLVDPDRGYKRCPCWINPAEWRWRPRIDSGPNGSRSKLVIYAGIDVLPAKKHP